MSHRLSTLFGALLAAAAGLAFGAVPDTSEAVAAGSELTDAPIASSTAAEGRLPLEDLRAFAEVLDRIRSAYVEEVDDRTLLENAIRGMLSDLDPHSSYLAGHDFDNLQEATSGEFGGVGLEVDLEDGLLRVISPIDDTPAARAGIEAGDLIISLDEKPVADMTLADAIDHMRGEPGSNVRLEVVRDGSADPLEFELVRDIIAIRSVTAKLLEPGYAYLRISQFQTRTGADVETAIADLLSEQQGPLQGLVLDLRNNPGGVLQASVDVADAFLDSGLIVYTKGRLANAQLSYHATRTDLTGGAPMIVLMNEGSASASEIVAGALQDHRRAVIMGTSSFGKGSVQTLLPLSDDRAIKLTTALYYTPNGRSIQALGIVPDITVERGNVNVARTTRRFREADLPNHLATGTASTVEARAKARDSAMASDDYQLAEALNMLKGLAILGLREAP